MTQQILEKKNTIYNTRFLSLSKFGVRIPTLVTMKYYKKKHNVAVFGPTPRAWLGWAEIDSLIFGHTTNLYANQ